MKKINVIETRSVKRDYGFRGTEAIIDHPKHGRLLVVDGYGGTDSPRGGCVRWEHGKVIRLRDDDTCDDLETTKWNSQMSVLEAVLAGYDDTRPALLYHSKDMEELATTAGL